MPGDGHEMSGLGAENKRLREALKKLEAEVRGLPAFEAAVREAIGDTNFNILMERADEARAALSSAPAEARQKTITVTVTPRTGNPARGVLRINCKKLCAWSLTDGPARTLPDGGREWHWDGNVEAPTISPSIDCQGGCGRHFTITAGKVA